MQSIGLRYWSSVFFVFLAQCASQGATLTVTNTNDTGPGSLRQAILESNNSVGVFDTITFNLPNQPESLVSRYSAEGDANDGVGGNNGALENDAAFGAGLIGRAFALDGLNDFVNVPDSPSINFGTGDFSVSVWVNFNSTAGEQVIVEKFIETLSPGTESGWSLTKLADNRVRFVVGPPDDIDSEVLSIPLGEWLHFVATRTGNNISVYMNKNLIASGMSSKNVDSTSSLKFGHRGNPTDTPGSNDTRGFYLNGLVDEVELYDRALFASEVESLFQLGSSFISFIPTDYVSFYRAEGNANDSGDDNVGMLNNGTSFAPGLIGQAFSFDGVDDTVIIPDSPSLDFTDQFTLAAWVNPSTFTFVTPDPVRDAGVLSKVGGPGGNNGFQLGLNSDYSQAFLQFNAPGEAWPGNQLVTPLPNPLPLGRWSHLVGVYDGESLHIYLNGVPAGSLAVGPKTIINSDSNLRINGDDNNHVYFPGLIDEAAVFNVGLSASQVREIYRSGNPVRTFAPSTPLPTLTDSVNIDGYTQPGAARNTNATGAINAVLKIELDGSNAGPSNGLTVSAGGSRIQGLAINRFAQLGIHLQNTGGNFIEGNFIGTDITGMEARQNGGSGVYVASPNNTIGGTTPASRNLSSGNTYHGVEISGPAALGNVVQGNLIGTNAAGNASLSGAFSFGILIDVAPNNLIGGFAPGAGNVVSGNASHGIEIYNSNDNRVEGNFIGTDATGTSALGNGARGVNVNDSSDNIIGGTVPGARNVISGNLNSGVRMLNPGSTGNVVQGNYIGVDVHGAIDLGNSSDGIIINNADGNMIGGSAAGAGNLISGNGDDGLELRDSFDNIVEGNRIGSDASGAVLIGNIRNGIFFNQSSGCSIGGTQPGAGNLIVGNGEAGIMVRDVSADNPFLMNSIHSNTGLGIDLGEDGPTPNDVPPDSEPPDQDAGPNGNQNFPHLVLTEPNGDLIGIEGLLASVPNTQFRIELFANTECDASGYGEGSRFLGSIDVTTDSAGTAMFEISVTDLEEGEFVTATATVIQSASDFGDSSEFSQCLEVLGGCLSQFPDFSVSGRIDAADLLRLLGGLREEDIAFDLTCDEAMSGDDLFGFSLDWYASEFIKER